MCKKVLSAFLVLTLMLTLIQTVFAAQKPDEEFVVSDDLVFVAKTVTPHEYLGEAKIGGLWYNDEPFDYSYSVYVVNDDIDSLDVQVYTTLCNVKALSADRTVNFRLDLIGGVVYLNTDVQEAQKTATKDNPFVFTFRNKDMHETRASWSPQLEGYNLYGENDDQGKPIWLGGVGFAAIVFKRSEVDEFRKTGTLPPVLARAALSEPKEDGSTWEYQDVSSLLDLTELKALLSDAPADAALSAVPVSSTVLVNGRNMVFNAYNIDGSNYFKLRDLA